MSDDHTTALDDTLWANARAITFRLLGDETLSEQAAAAAVRQTALLATSGPGSWIADPRWMTVLAAIAVDRSLVVDVLDVDDHPDLVEVRRNIRRRLARVEPARWVAPAVHHLAGYSLEDTAQLLGRSLPDVSGDAALLNADVDYRALGRAQTLALPRPTPTASPADSDADAEPSESRSHRRQRRPRSLSGTAVIVMLALIGGGITFTTLFPGQRASTAGPAKTEQRRYIGADVEPLPSAGCQSTSDTSGVTNPTVNVGGTGRTFRLAAPQAAVRVGRAVRPRPLLVGVPAGGQTAASFAAVSGLERAAADAFVATLEPARPWLAVNLDRDPRRPDDFAYASAVVESVANSRCVDLRRVHAIGLQVGGKFVSTLACAAPGTFASVVAVDEARLPAPCPLEPPVSLLEFARRPSAAGGSTPRSPAQSDVAAGWAAALNTTSGPGTIGGSGGTVVTDWTGGRWGAAVRFVSAPPSSANWPAGATPAALQFTKVTARAE